MKKTLLFTLALLIATNTAQAFIVENHCDDLETFSVSSPYTCEALCPNRYTSDVSGTGYISYACVSKNRMDLKDRPEEIFDSVHEESLVACPNRNDINKEECIRDALKKGKESIHIDEPNLSHLCVETNGYEMKDSYHCVKQCPTDKPLMGHNEDCYSCDIKYPILLTGARDYAYKDSELKNVCPNRVIIADTSYINVIEKCNTIEKIKQIISDGQYLQEDKDYDEHPDFGKWSLLEWNVMFNQNPEIIKYLLENDPKGFDNFVIRFAIDRQAPESVMKILLDKAKKDDLVIYLPHGVIYGGSLATDESWEVPMSFYAKQAGSSEEIQNLIKTYEKKFGIDYEPKIWVDSDEK